MAQHLKEISLAVDPGCHAVLVLDQAGWHGSARLPVPANITLLPLPPRSPELNPVENVWPFLRANWLSNRVFGSYNAVIPCLRRYRGVPVVLQGKVEPQAVPRGVPGVLT